MSNQNPEKLLGPDENKNGVRDDIEIFIKEQIAKEGDLFKAYLNFAESTSRILLKYPNILKVKEDESIRLSDNRCVSVIDKNESLRIQRIARIIDRIFDNTERSFVDRWYAENHHKIGSTIALSTKPIRKNEVCRF